MDHLTEKMLNLQILAQEIVKPTKQQLGLPDVSASDATGKKIFSIVFGVSAAIAILIIIISALNLTKSDGNPEEISKAKKGIIYALVGLLIVLSAETIVFFVMRKI